MKCSLPHGWLWALYLGVGTDGGQQIDRGEGNVWGLLAFSPWQFLGPPWDPVSFLYISQRLLSLFVVHYLLTGQ